jgi:molybdenum cofactor guanylyltransferase
VVTDSVPDFAGPLAGVLAGLDWATANAPESKWLASVPGDCPFLPRDLVARLHEARSTAGRPLACARSGEWRHPIVALWSVALRSDLRHAVVNDRHGVGIADWPAAPIDPFLNVNTPEEAALAEAIAMQYPNV